MSREYHRIRILWIEDLPGLGAMNANMGPFSEFFEIVGFDNRKGSSSVRSIAEYDALLLKHLSVQADGPDGGESPFPVEICSVDYDLSKFTPGTDTVGDHDHPEDFDLNEVRSPNVQDSGRENMSSYYDNVDQRLRETVNYDDYDGCLINTMYLSEFSRHPCGSVVTTYQEPSQRHRCAKRLEKHLERCCGIDLSFSGTRTWESVLHIGVKALQNRLKQLYKRGGIAISHSDLMALADNPNHGVLTVHSPHAVRRLPVQGLFINEPEDTREDNIREWAKEILQAVAVNSEEFKLARELAGLVWDAYKDNDLVEERRMLSLLAAQKAAGDNYDAKELERLCSEDHFNVRNFHIENGHAGGKCGSGHVDITYGSNTVYTGRVRRWASLLIIYNLLKHLALIRKKAVDKIEGVTGRTVKHLQGPVLTVNNLFLALFPVPESPLTVSWHVRGDTPKDQKKRSNAMGTWIKALMRFKEKKDLTKDKGDLALSVSDLYDGAGWDKNGPYGLFDAERTVLKGLVLGDSELGSSEDERERTMRAFEDARRIIWKERPVS